MQRQFAMRQRWFGYGLAAALLLAAPAVAQNEPAFRVTVNHAAPIKLQAPATVVLIADPDIADIVNEKNNLIFVLGRKPGVTNLLVYDANGKELLGRSIVVVPDESGMVTVTRDTDTTDYFCAPRCRYYEHELGGSAPAAPAGGAGAGFGGAGGNAGAAAAQNAASTAGAATQQTGAGVQGAAPPVATRPGYP